MPWKSLYMEILVIRKSILLNEFGILTSMTVWQVAMCGEKKHLPVVQFFHVPAIFLPSQVHGCFYLLHQVDPLDRIFPL